MIVEPNSNIRIIKCPIELDNLNQLTFATKAAQETWFKSLPYIQIDNSSYQRKDNFIRFPLGFDEAIQYNYVMYQNENYSNKWFYAFITDCQYYNDEMSLLKIETDVFQTWQFDIVYKPSFIEREMLSTADDVPGANTIPENVELGDYVLNGAKVPILDDKSDFYICMSVTELPDGTAPAVNASKIYNGIFGGLYYFAFTTAANCDKAIKIYDESGKSDAINSLFIIPKNMATVTGGTSSTWSYHNITTDVIYLKDITDSDIISTDMTLQKPSKLGENYIPINKKLLSYPYCYLNVTNNVGSTEVFRYEDWKIEDENNQITNEIGFWVMASLSPGMNIKAIPLFYKNENYNYNYGVIAGKLPICSWNSDVYVNWLTQNALNIPLSIAGSGLQIAGGVGLTATGAGSLAGGGQVASGILGIANTISQIYEASLTPNQARGNTNGSEINFADEAGIFTLYPMSIKDEYARIIDNFFSMYGYKTNLVKQPNLNNRSNWNYVKTINCNITGDIPQKDMQAIKDIFNTGVTLWHNPSTFLDYSQTNS